MIMTHQIRPDGQKASPEEIERAKAWNRAGCDRTAKPATSAATKSYKSPEFVQSDIDYESDLDATPKLSRK